jgi:hypothetical protein
MAASGEAKETELERRIRERHQAGDIDGAVTAASRDTVPSCSGASPP